jgi:hypothetical protein
MLLVSLNLRFVGGVSIPSVDDAVATAQDNVAPFQPLITATEGAVEQTDLTKAVKEGIGHFFEGMPIFMSALDASGLASFHWWRVALSLTLSMCACGVTGETVVVITFKAVYTLELKRRDNERKIIALYFEMKDMMGVLLLYVSVFTSRALLIFLQPPGRAR